jgi:hypothetical protein
VGRAQRELERAQAHEGLRDHLTVGEEIRLAARQHWAVLVKPAAIAVAVTAFAILVFVKSPARLGGTLPVVLIGITVYAWLVLGWRALVRHHDLFIATDKRVLKYQKIIVTNVPMMRMSKVTDLRFTRSFWGEILGYGTIVIESAGQDQAIRDIDFLPDPVENYQRLCEVIFGDKHHEGRGRKRKAWRRQLDRLTAGRRGGPDNDAADEDVAAEWDDGSSVIDDNSRAIPISTPDRAPAPMATHQPLDEVIFESEDIKARRRAADTGPIHYYPTNNPD